MTEKDLIARCKRLKVPRVFWDTADFRSALLRLLADERELCAAILDANAQCCYGLTAEILSSNAAAIRAQ